MVLNDSPHTHEPFRCWIDKIFEFETAANMIGIYHFRLFVWLNQHNDSFIFNEWELTMSLDFEFSNTWHFVEFYEWTSFRLKHIQSLSE